MELLLRLVTPRKVLLALLALGLARLLLRRAPEARQAYRAWRYPGVAADVGAAADIAREADRRRALHVQALTAAAHAGLQAARARGEDVSGLEIQERQAASIASADPGRAAELLNQVIARTPTPRAGLIPLAPEEADEEAIAPDARGKRRR